MNLLVNVHLAIRAKDMVYIYLALFKVRFGRRKKSTFHLVE